MSNRANQFAEAIGDETLAFTVGKGNDGLPNSFTPAAGEPPKMEGVLKRTKNSVIIPLEQLVPDPDQPRKHFDEQELDQLAESLKTEGQLQPIRVIRHHETSTPQKFIILMGERRYRAAKRAGKESLDAIVEKKRLSEEQKRTIQYVENALREAISPIDEARFFEEQIDLRKCSIRELAALLHIQPSTISRARKLLTLPEAIQREVGTGTLPSIVAYEIARLEDEAQQLEMLGAYKEGGVTATDIAKANPKSQTGKRSSKQSSTRTKKFSHQGVNVVATTKRNQTNAEIITALELFLAKLKADRRTTRNAA